jgi:hypothetical protein
MVYLDYTGRLGNEMFVYSFGRIIAEALNYKMNRERNVWMGEINLPPLFTQLEYHSPIQLVDGRGNYQPDLLDKVIDDKSPRKIFVSGYFQKYCFYKKYKEKVKSWFPIKLDPIISPNDIAIHLRKDDITGSQHDLPDSYFIDILKSESHDKIFITSDSPDCSTIKNIVNEFKNVILITGPPYATIQKLASFKKLILSQGTFSWWAGFLGVADVIYSAIPKTGFNVKSPDNPIDLYVTDEPRWKYIQL